MVRLLSQKGNTVVMVARNEQRLAEEAAQLPHAVPITCDLADEKALRRLVLRVKHEFPDLNVLLLNAGLAINYSLLDREDAFENSKAELITNYHSAVYLTQEFESLLAAKPAAAMILTTSGGVLAPDLNHPTYSATKAALHSLIPPEPGAKAHHRPDHHGADCRAGSRRSQDAAPAYRLVDCGNCL